MSPQGPSTSQPPLPPQLAAQMQAQQPPNAAPMFQSMGAQVQDPASQIMKQLAALESWLSDTKTVLDNTNPALSVLLVPIAKSGQALAQEAQQLQQRTAGPSPPVTGSVPPNVPGNMPGARPAM